MSLSITVTDETDREVGQRMITIGERLLGEVVASPVEEPEEAPKPTAAEKKAAKAAAKKAEKKKAEEEQDDGDLLGMGGDEEGGTVSLEDIRRTALYLIDLSETPKEGNVTCAKIFKDIGGVQSLKDIPEEKYSEVYAALSKALDELEA